MGKNLKIAVAVVGLVLVLAAIRIGPALVNPPSDQALIERALADAITAGKEGRPGSVLELLSQHLTVNGEAIGADSRQIANFVRDQKPVVVVSNQTAVVHGEEGRIVSPIELDLGILGTRHLNEANLIFRREDSTDYGIIPARKWKLVEVQVPKDAVQQLMQ